MQPEELDPTLDPIQPQPQEPQQDGLLVAKPPAPMAAEPQEQVQEPMVAPVGLAAPQDPEKQDPFLEAMRQRRLERQREPEDAFMRVWDAALRGPDSADVIGEAQRLGKELNLPEETVLRNPEVAKRIYQKRQAEKLELAKEYPKLAQTISDSPPFARIAKDRLESLSKIEESVKWWEGLEPFWLRPSRIPARAQELARMFTEEGYFGEGWTKAMQLYDIELEKQQIGYLWQTGDVRPEQIARLHQLEKDAEALGPVSSFAQAALSAAFLSQPMFRGAVVGSGAAVATAAVTAAAGVTAPAAPFTAMGAFVTMGTVEMTKALFEQYTRTDLAEMVKRGIPVEDARFWAPVSGSLQAALDTAAPVAGGQIRRELMRNVGKEAIERIVREMVTPMTSGRAAREFLWTWGKDTAFETVQEVAQDVTSTFFMELADTKTQLSREQLVDQLVETVKQSAMVSAWMTPVGPSVQLFRNMRRAARGADAGQLIEDLHDKTVREQVRLRNPELFAQYMDAVTQGTGAESLYINVEQLAGAWDRLVNLTMEKGRAAAEGTAEILPDRERVSASMLQEIRKRAPEVANAIETATRVGPPVESHVKISTSQYYTYLNALPIGDVIRPHLKFDPSMMSAAESQAYEREKQKLIEQAKAALQERKTDRDTWAEESQQVYDTVLERMRAAKAFGNDAERKQGAQLLQAMMVTMAANESKAGKPTTPMQAFRNSKWGRLDVVVAPPADGKQPYPTAVEELQILAEEQDGLLSEIDALEPLRAQAEAPDATQEIRDEYDAKKLNVEARMADLAERQVLAQRRAVAERELEAPKIPKVPSHLKATQDYDGDTEVDDDTDVFEKDRKQYGSTVPPEMVKMTPGQREALAVMVKGDPKMKAMVENLREDELAALVRSGGDDAANRAEQLRKLMEAMPTAQEMAAVAKAGIAKKGWYKLSAAAITRVFGADARRFAALLAALSPQTSVEANLANTLRVWRAWTKAGRPTNARQILKIMGENVQGDKGEKSVLGAWKNNAYRALIMENPERIVLSGPKVNSFMLNLLDDVAAYTEEVTNDAWMSNYSGIAQEEFGADKGAGMPGKGVGYLAMSLQSRRAARQLEWEGREIQETVWSFSKALYEKVSDLQKAGQDVTAESLITSGGLLHEDIAATPDFEKLFVDPTYRQFFDEEAYGTVLNGLAVEVAKRQETALTGSVYVGTPEELEHMRRAAKRLDALREHRKWLAARSDVLVNISSSTPNIPGLDKLTKEANAGNLESQVLLQEIANESLKYLLHGVESAQITVARTTGLHAGGLEPSLGLSLSFTNADRPAALVALRQFARMFDQQQIHLRQASEGRFGTKNPDGSYNTKVVKIHLNKPMPRAEVEKLARESGLSGFTTDGTSLEVYFVGDPKDAAKRQEFTDATFKAIRSLRDAGAIRRGAQGVRGGVEESVQRLWAYGSGPGATAGYDAIPGKFSPPRDDVASRAAQRVATRLAGREVMGSPQAPMITQDQREWQRRIADAYEAMRLNALDDPHVRRAYEELATELLEQFDALPIRVEAFADVYGLPAGTTVEQVQEAAKALGIPVKVHSGGVEVEYRAPADLWTEGLEGPMDPQAAAKHKAAFNRNVAKLRKALKATAEPVQGMPAQGEVRLYVFAKKGEPYPSKKMSMEMRQDVLSENHMWIYATIPDQFGKPGVDYTGHPLLADSGRTDMNGRPLLMNDLLRAVHDYYAHSLTTVGFGPLGEEAAWRNHMEMTRSPWARWALTTETRGQNSWVNFRPGVEGKPLVDRGFADQKADLLPIEFITTGNPEIDAALAVLPGAEVLNLEGPPATLEQLRALETPEQRELNAEMLDEDGNVMDMVAVHAIHEQFLPALLKTGKLPMPSVAVIRTGQEMVAEFGDVSLVMRRDVVDPIKGAATFDFDIFSAVYPTLQMRSMTDEEINQAVMYMANDAQEITKMMGVGTSDFGRGKAREFVYLTQWQIPDEKTLLALLRSTNELTRKGLIHSATTGLRALWLKKLGVLTKLSDSSRQYAKEIADAMDRVETDLGMSAEDAQASFKAFATARIQEYGIADTERLVTVGGKQVEATPENVLAAMVEFYPEIRATENTIVRAELARQFQSLAEMQRQRTRLRGGNIISTQSDDKWMRLSGQTANLRDSLMELAQHMANKHPESVALMEYRAIRKLSRDIIDNVRDQIVAMQESGDIGRKFDVRQLKKVSVKPLMDVLEKAAFDIKKEQPALLESISKQLTDIINVLMTDTQPYWESKTPRIVKLDEVAAVVLPSNAEAELVEQVQRAGLPIKIYNKGDTATRARLIADVAKETHTDEQPVLFAEGAGEPRRPRAKINLDTYRITLDPEANVTAWFHELTHGYQQMLFEMARDPNASPWVLEQVTTLLNWFNIGTAQQTMAERLQQWDALGFAGQKPYWEQLAYNSEVYVATGKAPTTELERVFQSVRNWVRTMYKQISTVLNNTYRNLFKKDLPGLTPEVRGFFDRMLATEEQIQQAQWANDMVPMFTSLEGAPMTAEQLAEYQALDREATEEAITEMDKIRLNEMRLLRRAPGRALAEVHRLAREVRAGIYAEVAQRMRRQPIYRLMHYLRTGELIQPDGTTQPATANVKLSLELVRALFPKQMGQKQQAEALQRMGVGRGGMLRRDGMHPDDAAELFGFESGEQMVFAIIRAPDLDEAIEVETDRRAKEEYGELFTPEAMENALVQVLNNKARTRFIASELRWLDKAARTAMEHIEVAREAARQILAGKKIREIKPREFKALEADARREAIRAWKRGDAQAAIVAKRRELLYHEMAKQAVEIRRRVEAAKKKWAKMFRPDKKIAKTRMMDLVDVARSLLAAHGFERAKQEPAQYLELMAKYSRSTLNEMLPLFVRAQENPVNYKDLTLEDFDGLNDAVTALWNMAKRKKQIRVEGKLADVATALEPLNARMQELGVPAPGEAPGESMAPSTMQRAMRQLMVGRGLLRRIGAWARAMDGAEDGPFTRYIYRPVREAWDVYKNKRVTYLTKVRDIMVAVPMKKGKIKADPETEFTYTYGNGNGGIGIAELMGSFQHMGNSQNLRNNLVGRGIAAVNPDGTVDTSGWWRFVNRMVRDEVATKAHFDALQKLWDLYDELLPLIQEMHYDRNGYRMKEVKAEPFTITFPDGQTVTYRGGYVPAKMDSWLVPDAMVFEEIDVLDGDFRQQVAKGNDGFTKERVKKNERPLNQDIRLILKHMDDVLRYVYVQGAISDVQTIIKSDEFKRVADRFDPTMHKMLMYWLVGTAHAITTRPGLWQPFDRFWNAVRRRVTANTMFANVRNILQQFTGWFPALVAFNTDLRPAPNASFAQSTMFALRKLLVNANYLRGAYAQWQSAPIKTNKFIRENSPYMTDRMLSQTFDLTSEINELVLNPGRFNKGQKFWEKHALIGQQLTQTMVDAVTWMAAFNAAMDNLPQDMDQKAMVKEAAWRGDEAVRLSQSSSEAPDVAEYQRTTPFFAMLSHFSGYFNAMGNLQATEYVRMIREMGFGPRVAPQLLYVFLLAHFLPSLIGDGISRALGGQFADDEGDGYLDEVLAWLFGSQVSATAAMIPVAGPTALAALNAVNDKPYDDRMMTAPSISNLEAAARGATLPYKAFTKDELSGRDVRDVFTLLSLLTGYPLGVVGRGAGYAVDVERGAVEPYGTGDYVRGLITGQAAAGTK